MNESFLTASLTLGHVTTYHACRVRSLPANHSRGSDHEFSLRESKSRSTFPVTKLSVTHFMSGKRRAGHCNNNWPGGSYREYWRLLQILTHSFQTTHTLLLLNILKQRSTISIPGRSSLTSGTSAIIIALFLRGEGGSDIFSDCL